MTLSFAGKCVVVTGASRGIGLAVAQAFRRAGAAVHAIWGPGSEPPFGAWPRT